MPEAMAQIISISVVTSSWGLSSFEISHYTLVKLGTSLPRVAGFKNAAKHYCQKIV